MNSRLSSSRILSAPYRLAFSWPAHAAWISWSTAAATSGPPTWAGCSEWRYGILVFILDFAKGPFPWPSPLSLGNTITHSFLRSEIVEAASLWNICSRKRACWKLASVCAAFLGHLFPIYLRFRGGKGVATGGGVVAVLMPIPTLAATLAWLVLTASFRFMSLASIVAALVLCGTQLGMTECEAINPRNWFCVLAALLVLARHGGNLVRLQHGTENRLKETVLLHQIAKTLHVLAVGLWFGSVAFFILVALSVFQNFEDLTKPSARTVNPGCRCRTSSQQRKKVLSRDPRNRGDDWRAAL